MKRNTLIEFQVVMATVLIVTLAGCSGSRPNPKDIVETRTLGAQTKSAPARLSQSAYRIPASQTGYAAFSLSGTSTVGYMITDGTVEIFDAGGEMKHSDIFFPMGSRYNTVRLDGGNYLIKIQNCTLEDRSFTIYADGMELKCTTFTKGGSVRIAGKSHEFIVLDIREHRLNVRASLPSGTLTLYDPDFNERIPGSNAVTASLSTGKYILLADNKDSKTYGTLDITMDLN
jgi:hypothetical protein